MAQSHFTWIFLCSSSLSFTSILLYLYSWISFRMLFIIQSIGWSDGGPWPIWPCISKWCSRKGSDGLVSFWVHIRDQPIVFSLKFWLHAPGKLFEFIIQHKLEFKAPILYLLLFRASVTLRISLLFQVWSFQIITYWLFKLLNNSCHSCSSYFS